MKSPRTEILHDINPREIVLGTPLFNNTFNTTTRAALRMGDWKIVTGHPSIRELLLNRDFFHICTVVYEECLVNVAAIFRYI